jgi:adenosylcobinamide kinase / adenosylcobinamide-phosphate guanylyltransferase
VSRNELIVGGQRSGESRCAEATAAEWLFEPARSAVLIATVLESEEKVEARVQHQRMDRTRALSAMGASEAPLVKPLMPLDWGAMSFAAWRKMKEKFRETIAASPAPVLLASKEIGVGVSAMSREARVVHRRARASRSGDRGDLRIRDLHVAPSAMPMKRRPRLRAA